MKKIFFLFLALSVVMACSDDDKIDDSYDIRVTSGTEFLKDGDIYFTVDGGSMAFTVTTDIDWDHEVSGTWFTAVRNGNVVTLVAPENTTGNSQTSKLTFYIGGRSGEPVAYDIFQSSANAEITVSEDEVAIRGNGGEASITVEATHAWDVDYDDTWLTATKQGNSLVFSAGANPDTAPRSEMVTLYTSEGDYNSDQVTVTVTQGLNAVDMIIEITIPEDASTSNTYVARLPFSRAVSFPETEERAIYALDCTIDWGDGSEVEHVTTSHPTHEYTRGGAFDVTISGTVECLYAGTNSNAGWNAQQRGLITAVKQWGCTGLTYMYWPFYQMVNLKTIPTDDMGSFEQVTYMANMFAGCTSLEVVPEGLFDYAVNNTYMYYAFWNCSSITSVPDNLFASMPLLTDVGGALGGTSVTSVSSGLFGEKEFVFKVNQVFYNTPIEEVPGDIFAGMPNITNASGIFWGCSNLKTVPVEIFDNHKIIKNFSNLFRSCSSLEGESPYTEIGGWKIHLYERSEFPEIFDLEGLNSGYCFRDATFSDAEDIPSAWK